MKVLNEQEIEMVDGGALFSQLADALDYLTNTTALTLNNAAKTASDLLGGLAQAVAALGDGLAETVDSE